MRLQSMAQTALRLAFVALLLTPLVGQLASAQEDTPEKPAVENAIEKKADEKPDAEKPAATEEKPAATETKPADEKPAEEKPAEEKPAEEKPAEAKPAEEKPAAPQDAAAAKAEWEKNFTAWKDLLRQLYELRVKYESAGPDELDVIRKEYGELLAKGETMIPQLQSSAVTAFEASPNDDRELTRFLVKLIADEIRADAYEPAYELSQKLIAHKADDESLWNLAGISAFCTNHFDEADEYFTKATDAGALSSEGQKFAGMVEQYRELWTAEEKIREAEAKADDLPRVLLKTNQGDITIELFENEAPQAVGNFVNLVEKGFYDGLSFHRVLKGFMAQGGDPQGNGSGGPGYEIYCECEKPDHRKHFRGTLSMAHAGKNTGGSQFFLTFVPTGHLNGRHTAFGRVIDGMEVLSKLKRTREGAPAPKEKDQILSAKVLRKRDHEYKPTKVE